MTIPWEAQTPATALLRLGPMRSRGGGGIEVQVGSGLPTAAPGQFVMIDVGDGVLPHPFTVFRSHENGTFTLLIRPGGRPVAALLRRLHAREPVRVIGPLGRPFPRPAGGARAWLVAEQGRIAPLFGLAAALRQDNVETTVWAGGQGGAHFSGLGAFQAAGIRTGRVRGDGWPALTRALSQAAESEDTLYVAGPEAALASASDAASGVRSRIYVAVEVAMACGVGACYGCPVALRAPVDERHPYVRACTEGPVFDAGEVRLT